MLEQYDQIQAQSKPNCGRAEAIVEEFRAAVTKWPDYADQAEV